jgi:LuxR family transcriptional regulator, maltose regulon positive regulatory protein
MTAILEELAPSRDGSQARQAWVMVAFLLGAIARERLGDPAGQPVRQHASGVVLTHGETKVLYYLPTNLSAREIADELFLSVNTIKTHQRHVYQKLGARNRSEAVERARTLGLLAPSSRRYREPLSAQPPRAASSRSSRMMSQ